MNRSNTIILIVVGLVILLMACCICLAIFGGAFFLRSSNAISSYSLETSGPTPQVIRPTNLPPATQKPQATQGAQITMPPDLPSGYTPITQTLNILENTVVPINSLPDLARRLEGKQNIPTTIEPPASPLQTGDQQSFWVSNVDSNNNFQIDATLQYITDHVYFWIEDGVNYRSSDLKKLADTFEQKIYPTDREFFGSEWSPGVDDDPHLYILYASGLGNSLAGYFSSADEYSPEAHEYSNAHEMFLLNADNVSLDEEFAYGVLAHEFQHMIHWYRDRNEETWMNEGFSELAMFLNKYDVGGTDFLYTRDPDIQLTDWPNGNNNTGPHYGAAFLFLDYFLNRFGEDATKAVVADPANGMVSIDQVLSGQNAVDPLSGKTIQADDVFADWIVASYLQDGRVGDGRFNYDNYPGAPQPSETETISSCPQKDLTRDVHQYGVDYIRIDCSGSYNLHFEGSVQTSVVPVDPFSGSYAFWSNRGDESDMTLTHAFDFSDVSGPITFSYWTWYDLEHDYDYLYLVASTDGENWQILTTPSGTSEDPSGNSYGWGYNGESGNGPDWIQESVDISQFAGQKVQLRFEYVTDAAVNGQGFLLDDVSIPETGYFTDFESGDGGWVGDGFVRIQNVLPQTYRLSVIHLGQNTVVDQYSLSGENVADIPIEIGNQIDEIILVVSGTTRFTTQKAAYRFSIQP
jgi:immune inhibitor A